MASPARLKANEKFHADRKAKGWRKVTVWLDPETAMRVDAFKAAAGSADEVHRKAIKAWAGPGTQVIAVKPVSSAKKPPQVDVEDKNKVWGVQLGPTERKPGSMLIDKSRKRK